MHAFGLQHECYRTLTPVNQKQVGLSTQTSSSVYSYAMGDTIQDKQLSNRERPFLTNSLYTAMDNVGECQVCVNSLCDSMPEIHAKGFMTQHDRADFHREEKNFMKV